MEGEESAQSAERPSAAAAAEHQGAAAAAPAAAAGRKRGAAVLESSGSPVDSPAQQAGAEAAAEAAAEPEAEAQPPKKKAKARTGRKRLDPIVRDALRAAEEKPGGQQGVTGWQWVVRRDLHWRDATWWHLHLHLAAAVWSGLSMARDQLVP